MARIEKVARALAIADARDPDRPIGRWQPKRIVGKTIPVAGHDPARACWHHYVPLARLFAAAAEALREP